MCRIHRETRSFRFPRLSSERRIAADGRTAGKKDKQYQIRAAGMFVLYVAREGYNNNIGTNASAGGVYSRHDGSRRKS